MTAKVELHSASFVFTQDSDSGDIGGQSITVTADDCGGGHYFVIETTRWAFDDAKGLGVLLADVRQRLDGLWRDDA